MFTITPPEFSKLLKTRQLQIERYRTAYYAKHKKLPDDTDHLVDPTYLLVKLNDLAFFIPVKLLAQWSATFPEAHALSVEIGGGNLLVRRGGSSLRLMTFEPIWHDDKPYRSGFTDGPVESAVEIENDGGTLTVKLPDIQAELKALKQATTANRKAEAKEKAIARTLKAEREAKARLTDAIQRAEQNQAVLDSMTLNQATKLARRCLEARRIFRLSLDSTIVPPWLPATHKEQDVLAYCNENRDVWNDVNTVEAWSELAKVLAAATDARKAYKPRLSWPRFLKWEPNPAAYKKANPDRAVPIYGPQYDKLKEAERKARQDMARFLQARFAEWCAVQGLPDLSGEHTWYWLDKARAYSRARLAMRTWPGERDDLESKVREAVQARENAEGS